ncbi:hypothetical protein [Winogradskyella sp.]|uniref:tetratricopeptide repeat protein n=1 Tax=Winogradskyella sp. TaxID=1883156 RepID=UPI002607F079|nr:hypothetical protein [Winogradskyella sp.]
MSSQSIEPLKNNINYGDYAVGFSLIEKHDNSRVYQLNQISQSNKRPLQIGVWYPAKNLNGNQLSLADYIKITSRSESLVEESKKEQKVIAEFKNAAHVDNSRSEKVLSSSFMSRKNSDAAEGKFPLIIYAPASSAPFHENFLLFEYLASKGYVVMSSKSRGVRSPTTNARWSGVEAQVRDMEFIMAEASKMKNVDVNNISVIGRSWGSIAALVFSIRNKEVTRSITSLDGTLSYNAIELLKDSPYTDGSFVYRPIFLAVGKKRSENATPIDRKNYYEDIVYADAHTVEYDEMRHTAFSSYFLIYHYLLNKGIDAKTSDDLITGYINAIEHIEEFISFYCGKSDKINIDSSESYGYTSKEASKILPPNYEDFGYALQVNGVDAAISVYEQAFKSDPDYANKELFGASYINTIAYKYLSSGETNDAIKLIEMAIRAYPNNANLYDSYGEFLLKNGNKEQGRKAYEKSLKLNPKNDNARKILDEMKK